LKIPDRFLVIDDDKINNMLCRIVIENAAGNVEIQTFNIAEKGFEYIEKEYGGIKKEKPAILFLDINMPGWNGWEFLENFERLDENIKKQIQIYMLSSSVDSKDIHRAKSNKNVVDYIIKPLTTKTVSEIIAA
jgi:CheY-like chemotaxis protein